MVNPTSGREGTSSQSNIPVFGPPVFDTSATNDAPLTGLRTVPSRRIRYIYDTLANPTIGPITPETVIYTDGGETRLIKRQRRSQ